MITFKPYPCNDCCQSKNPIIPENLTRKFLLNSQSLGWNEFSFTYSVDGGEARLGGSDRGGESDGGGAVGERRGVDDPRGDGRHGGHGHGEEDQGILEGEGDRNYAPKPRGNLGVLNCSHTKS